jgi:hypothetical protein
MDIHSSYLASLQQRDLVERYSAVAIIVSDTHYLHTQLLLSSKERLNSSIVDLGYEINQDKII